MATDQRETFFGSRGTEQNAVMGVIFSYHIDIFVDLREKFTIQLLVFRENSSPTRGLKRGLKVSPFLFFNNKN